MITRSFSFLVSAVILTSAPTATAAQAYDPAAALVRIFSKKGGAISIGAGVLIDARGTVLTAYHVIQGAQMVTVTGTNGQFRTVSVIAFDSRKDIAMLRVGNAARKRPLIYMPVGTVPPNCRGRVAFAWGYPDGKPAFQVHIDLPFDGLMSTQQYRVERGARLFAIADVEILPIDGTIDPGMSGGPVILDGKVIAVVSGTQAPRNRAFGWAIPSTSLEVPRAAQPIQLSSLPPPLLLNSDKRPLLLKTALDAQQVDDEIDLLKRIHEERQALETVIGEQNSATERINEAIKDDQMPLIEQHSCLETEIINQIGILTRVIMERVGVTENILLPFSNRAVYRLEQYDRLKGLIIDRIGGVAERFNRESDKLQDIGEVEALKRDAEEEIASLDLVAAKFKQALSIELTSDALLIRELKEVGNRGLDIETSTNILGKFNSNQGLHQDVSKDVIESEVAKKRKNLIELSGVVAAGINAWRDEMAAMDAAQRASETFLQLTTSPEIYTLAFE